MQIENCNLFSCGYINELNSLEKEGYSQEEALIIIEDLESPEALKRSQELLEISKKINLLLKQGMSFDQALEKINPILSE